MTFEEMELASVLAGDEASTGGVRKAFELLFIANPQPMWIYERQTLRFLAVNTAAMEKYGYSRDEFLSLTLADIRPEEDVERLLAATRGEPRTGYNISESWRHRTADGKIIYVNIHSHNIIYDGKQAVLIVAADISELLATIHELETQKAYFQQLFHNSPEGIVLLDRNGAVMEANEGFQKMFGYTRDELAGRTPLSLIVPDDAAESSMQSFNTNVVSDEAARLTTVRQRKDGALLDVEVLAYPLKVNGVAQGVFAIYQDITEKRRALREIEHQALHDSLTGLANRAHLAAELEKSLKEGQAVGALLYIDLDQFKVINDTFGHSVGDKALAGIAGVLKSQLRDTDVVARLGGDEFAVLLARCSEANALKRAEAILEAIRVYKFVWDGRAFPLGASIGVVELGDHFTSVEEALSAADVACYAAKDAGRNRARVYRVDDEGISSRRTEITWLVRLRRAIEEGRFALFFQEIHSLADAVEGTRHKEILLRYRDDDGTLVPPGAFIPSAERYNLMPAIDRWVLKATCEHLQRNRSKGAPPEMVSVNLSGTTLSDESFPEFAIELIKASNIDPASLCFEITETAAISNLVAARRLIAAVKDIGCSISLDDFGSGMSSFNYLRSLSVDYLKIDGTFVRELHRNQVDCAMTEAINHVGKILGLKTIAEFVENRAIYDKLKEIGVDYAQGYGLHVPEPWED